MPLRAALVFLAAFTMLAVSATGSAGGIDCSELPNWSANIRGYRVNLHHVYCGEAGRNGRAKGFHAMPKGRAPSTYLGSKRAGRPNGAGVYTLRNVDLKIHGALYTKSFSSMFPEHCSRTQIDNSIVYSRLNNKGDCASPGWAQCGPSGPAKDNADFCMGSNGRAFDVATALLRKSRKINTGFPIYKR